MNEYRIESDIIKHNGQILSIVTVYKDDVIVGTTREVITSIIQQINEEEQVKAK